MVRVFSIYIYGAQRGGLGIAFQAELKSNEYVIVQCHVSDSLKLSQTQLKITSKTRLPILAED